MVFVVFCQVEFELPVDESKLEEGRRLLEGDACTVRVLINPSFLSLHGSCACKKKGGGGGLKGRFSSRMLCGCGACMLTLLRALRVWTLHRGWRRAANGRIRSVELGARKDGTISRGAGDAEGWSMRCFLCSPLPFLSVQ